MVFKHPGAAQTPKTTDVQPNPQPPSAKPPSGNRRRTRVDAGPPSGQARKLYDQPMSEEAPPKSMLRLGV